MVAWPAACNHNLAPNNRDRSADPDRLATDGVDAAGLRDLAPSQPSPASEEGDYRPPWGTMSLGQLRALQENWIDHQGPAHPDTMHVTFCLITCLLEMATDGYATLAGARQALSEALPLALRNLRCHELLHGAPETWDTPTTADHHRVLDYMAQLAACMHGLGQHDDAEKTVGKACCIAHSCLGADHWDTIDWCARLASCWSLQRRHAEAVQLYRHVVGTYTQLLGLDNGSTVLSIMFLGQALCAAGQVEEGVHQLRRALQLNIRKLGLQHRNTIATMDALARVLVQQGRCAEAEPLARRVLAGCIRDWGPDHCSSVGAASTMRDVTLARGVDAPAGAASNDMSSGDPE